MMNQGSKHLLKEKISWLQKRSAGLTILAAVLDTESLTLRVEKEARDQQREPGEAIDCYIEGDGIL